MGVIFFFLGASLSFPLLTVGADASNALRRLLTPSGFLVGLADKDALFVDKAEFF